MKSIQKRYTIRGRLQYVIRKGASFVGDSSMLSEKVYHSWYTPVWHQKRYPMRGILQYGIRKGTLCVVDSSMVDQLTYDVRLQI